jgi:hypothetical protein
MLLAAAFLQIVFDLISYAGTSGNGTAQLHWRQSSPSTMDASAGQTQMTASYLDSNRCSLDCYIDGQLPGY